MRSVEKRASTIQQHSRARIYPGLFVRYGLLGGSGVRLSATAGHRKSCRSVSSGSPSTDRNRHIHPRSRRRSSPSLRPRAEPRWDSTSSFTPEDLYVFVDSRYHLLSHLFNYQVLFEEALLWTNKHEETTVISYPGTLHSGTIFLRFLRRLRRGRRGESIDSLPPTFFRRVPQAEDRGDP